MSILHIKPTRDKGKVFDVTPDSANWSYVGFGLYKLTAGEHISENTQSREAILVLIEGKANLQAGGLNFGEMGERMSVFERIPPHAIYVSGKTEWSATASTDCILAVCTAPARGAYPIAQLGPEGIETSERGKGANTRYINNIAMEGRDVASSLLVTEVFTPAGNWSSYPPHRHDVNDYPNITYLEETYYHRLNPPKGFGFQRVYTEDGKLDENMAVKDGDVVLVPKGHHPCAAPYGYEMYYLNVMAGPLRKWCFLNDPDHDWIYKRDLREDRA